jgi:amino acid transporter
MMERAISIGLYLAGVLSSLASAFGVFMTLRGVYLGFTPLIIIGGRTALLALGALIVVLAVISIRKRLTKVEQTLR